MTSNFANFDKYAKNFFGLFTLNDGGYLAFFFFFFFAFAFAFAF